MLSEWLQQALEATGIKQAELSRRMTELLGRSIDRAAVNKMTKNERAISGDEVAAIEQITGWEAPSTIQVPLLGYVGAGGDVLALDNGDDETVDAPRDTRPGTVAVRVRGTSMHPAYEEGSLLYYSTVTSPSELLNKRAVVQLTDGTIMVKTIRAGSAPGLWNLESLDPNVPTFVDKVVEWAAKIDWVKPA